MTMNSRPRQPSQQPAQRQPRTVGLRTRLMWVGCTLGVAALALVARAVDLQFINQDFDQQQGDQRADATETASNPRARSAALRVAEKL